MTSSTWRTVFWWKPTWSSGEPAARSPNEAAELLLRYPWPGNVRELRNVIRRVMLLASDVIEPDDLAFPFGRCVPDDCTPGRAGAGSLLSEGHRGSGGGGDVTFVRGSTGGWTSCVRSA